MAQAPKREVFGATITAVTEAHGRPCDSVQCPHTVTWFVVAEHGDDDDGLYSCSCCLESTARTVIVEERMAGDGDEDDTD